MEEELIKDATVLLNQSVLKIKDIMLKYETDIFTLQSTTEAAQSPELEEIEEKLQYKRYLYCKTQKIYSTIVRQYERMDNLQRAIINANRKEKNNK